MRFIVDAQLPPALARWLVDRGHEAEHVSDRGLETASDAAIWDMARQAAAAITTKDEDFAYRKAISGSGSSSGSRRCCPVFYPHSNAGTPWSK